MREIVKGLHTDTARDHMDTSDHNDTVCGECGDKAWDGRKRAGKSEGRANEPQFSSVNSHRVVPHSHHLTPAAPASERMVGHVPLDVSVSVSVRLWRVELLRRLVTAKW